MPIVVSIMQALSDGAKSQIELRRIAGSPAQSTLRAQLKRLSEIGAIEKRRRDRFPGALEYELTAPGRDLLFVLDVLGRWLDRAPDGSPALGSNAAKAAIKALTESWSTTMLRALAARPLSLTELDGLIGSLSYPALERRLAALRLAGLAEARPGNGRGTPYAVTKWLCMGMAPLTAATRWERRNLPTQTAPITQLDVETGFLLAVPRLHPVGNLSGSCRLAMEVRNGKKHRLAGVVAEVAGDGTVSACTTNLEGSVDAWVLGSATAWLNAVVEHDTDRLELGGDGRLARALVESLHRALFEVPTRSY